MLVIILALAVVFLGLPHAREQISPRLTVFPRIITEFASPAPSFSQEVGSVVESLLDMKNARYSIVVESLADPKKRYALNSDTKVQAASLYKLFLLAAVMRSIEEKRLSMDSVLSGSRAHLEEVLGGKEPGYESGKEGNDNISFSVGYGLDRVVRLSDNYAALLLAERVGWDALKKEADLIGASQSSFGVPTMTSAEDVASFFRLAYQEKLVSKEASEKIIELLKKAEINNRIPAMLPKDIAVAHKTGELSGIRHDAGIVFSEGEPYVIVLMAYDVTNTNKSISTLARVSKAVYDYFTK